MYIKRSQHLLGILVFSCLFLLTDQVKAQDFLFQNFNSTPGSTFPAGWAAVNSGDPACPFLVQDPLTYAGENISMRGSNFAFCNGDPGGSGSTTDASLTSPAFNSSAASILFLEFYQYYRDYSGTTTDSAIVEVYNGTSWVKVQSLDQTTGTSSNPSYTKINITAYKNANMKIRFRSVGVWPWYWAFDDVKVFSPTPNDIGVSAVLSPFGDCGLSASTQVKVQVSNYGSAAQTSIPLKYKVNNGAEVSQTFTGNLLPGTTQEFTFSTTQNLTAAGDYFVTSWSALPGDASVVNDSTVNVKSTKTGSSFGTISFTGYNGDNLSTLYPGWKEQTGTNPTGTTSAWRAAATAQITALNNQTAAINLYTTSRNEWIVTPSVVPNASSGLVFKTAVTNWLTPEPDQMGSDDAVKVMVSTSCGQTWTVLKTFNRSSGLTNSFSNQSIPLSAYAGQEIRLAFYATDGPVDDAEDYDFHIDSIRIKDLPPVDMSAGAVTSPESGCSVGTPVLSLPLTNLGTQPISNFPVCVKINGGTPVCQNFTGTLAPNETANFSFTNLTAIAQPGDYTLEVYTNATSDGDAGNNNAPAYTFQNLPTINTFPYSQNFENGNGGWIPGGTFSSWVLGTPAKTTIQGAAQGSKAYVTGGLGTSSYNSSEKSFVLGPCMDFTNIANPMFEMKAWWASEYSEDGAILQSSIDGGNTWQVVGAFNNITNWYNDNTIDGLTGIQGLPRVGWTGGLNDNFGSNGWRLVRNELIGLGGQSSVKLRIAFGAGANVAGDGFAFDDIRISEKKDKDVAFAGLDRPQPVGCGLTDTTFFRIKVQNVGKDTLKSVTFGYRVIGSPIVQRTIPVLIPASETYTYKFPVSENLSAVTTYSIQAWAKTPNDGFTGNDSTQLINITKRGAFTDTVRFNGLLLNGTNLPVVYPGWSVSNGNPLPTTTTSNWRACQPNQATYYGTTVARINMAGADRKDWILAPAYKIQPNAFLNFSVAVVEGFDTINDGDGGFTGTDDRLRVMVTQDCGSSWTEVFAVSSTDGVNRNFKNFKASLAAYAGQEIRFAFWATSFPNADVNNYDVLLNRIFIETLAPKDAGVLSVNAPNVSCGLSNSVPVTITLRNFGSASISNIPVSFKVNQDNPVNEVFAGPLAPLTSVTYTFIQSADLSLGQPYTITAYTSLAQDSVTTNDQASISLTRLIAPVPVQSLAGYNGTNLPAIWNGWNEGRGFGTPVIQNSAWTAGTVAGTNSFKITLANNQKLDWIVSPGIKINSGNFLRFKAGQFSVGGTNAAQFDVDDSITVFVSTNCGTNWTKIFRIGKNMTPALTNNLQEYSVSLNAFVNKEIRIGFRARDGVRQDFPSDIYLNDIEITSTLSQDAGPVQFYFNPPIVNNTFLKDSIYAISMRVTNFGTQAVNAVPCGVKLADGTTLGFTGSAAVAPGQSANYDLGTHVFTNIVANKKAKFYTGLTGDQAIVNDTLVFTYSVADPVSVDPLDFRDDVKVYPNPSQGTVVVSFGDSFYGQSTIELIDMQGRSVLNMQPVSGSQVQQLDLGKLPKGLYQIFIRQDKYVFHKTLVLE